MLFVQLTKTDGQLGRLFWIAASPLARHGSVHGVGLNGLPEMVYVWQLLYDNRKSASGSSMLCRV
jgi:hypothetical protein